jgi:hypothetical protein
MAAHVISEIKSPQVAPSHSQLPTKPNNPHLLFEEVTRHYLVILKFTFLHDSLSITLFHCENSSSDIFSTSAMAPEKLSKEERDHVRRVLLEGKKISNESLGRSIANTPVANRYEYPLCYTAIDKCQYSQVPKSSAKEAAK